MAFIKTSQHTSKWDSVGLHQGKKEILQKVRCNWMVGEGEVGRRLLPQQVVFSGEGDTLHLDVVASLQPLLPSAGVAGSNSPGCLTGICTPPTTRHWRLLGVSSQSNPDTTELLFTICVMCQFRSISAGLVFSQSITEWSLISVSIVLIPSHVSYLLQQYF